MGRKSLCSTMRLPETTNNILNNSINMLHFGGRGYVRPLFDLVILNEFQNIEYILKQQKFLLIIDWVGLKLGKIPKTKGHPGSLTSFPKDSFYRRHSSGKLSLVNLHYSGLIPTYLSVNRLFMQMCKKIIQTAPKLQYFSHYTQVIERLVNQMWMRDVEGF